MNVFDLRHRLISDYAAYIRSFINIRDARIQDLVREEFDRGHLWPEPLIQLNPSFEPGPTIDELVAAGMLHAECSKIFRIKEDPRGAGRTLRLHRHQADAVRSARGGGNYVLTTGTGSGKSLAYIVPIVDALLREGPGRGIRAIVVYPMNALANSQEGELRKFLCHGYPDGKGPITFARYTGQERHERRREILADPPDILLTNYVMLELILTRPEEQPLIRAARGLRFLVLDELHTYRGRQGADVALLVRRTRDRLEAKNLQCVGTSATLAGSGSLADQRREVADVATRLFGAPVEPAHVIGETLRRATPERDPTDAAFRAALRACLENPAPAPPTGHGAFVADPLSSWIETAFGLAREPETDRLVRRVPRTVGGDGGAAQDLASLTGLPVERCRAAIERQLLASYTAVHDPETGFPVFAFRLHQFLSRGDTVYASPEREATRHLTLHGQQYVPGSRDRILLPLVFCRECGQEYYCIRLGKDEAAGPRVASPRELNDHEDGENGEAGFLYASEGQPWPMAPLEVERRIPDDWLEEHKGSLRIRSARKADLPRPVRLAPDGREHRGGAEFHFVPAPFRFCLACGVAYDFHQRSDFSKLTSLATEGRSTATTVLSLSAIRHLRADPDLAPRARKLLSFTDNRQDASLQAGHFNDFVEIGLLRSALLRAAADAGAAGLMHDVLPQRVFEALALPLEQYAVDPEVKYLKLDDTRRALRDVLEYRLYRDLQRGWRITSPNLEQCGLLEIRYRSLEELCANDEDWKGRHPVLAGAAPETRAPVAKTLLDYMRRELAIKVECLRDVDHERLRRVSGQLLCAPWAIDENEKMEKAALLYPRPSRQKDYGGNVYLSSRGGFGQYLRRQTTFPRQATPLKVEDSEAVIRDLLNALRVAGLVEIVDEAREAGQAHGYQVPASAMVWAAGDGTRPFHDPIRVPRRSTTGGRPNLYFVDHYRGAARDAIGLEAREHTAQVKYEPRIEREERFRSGDLPILYCSPTMELGVDIAELNVVNLRNAPPTPANYAQRSGRAGRSGQPALVFTYCSTYSSHDQYFFRRPHLMVAGAVHPPRLDLANEDLVRSHMHAVWLAETGLPLGSSLREVLDLAGDEPTLDLLSHARAAIEDAAARARALARSRGVLASLQDDLAAAPWHSDGWLEEVLSHTGLAFDQACERWRDLYRAALRQFETQTKVVKDASRGADDKAKARRLRAEAEAQLTLLTEASTAVEADFYSYRYFASEGFLPGYSFPRLPLSAYIPGRQGKKGREEFLSRPRFLAISEFAPRAIVYHEGARYRINRVILPVRESGDDIVTSAAKQCLACGYMHPVGSDSDPDLCERCGGLLGAPLAPLFRLENVSTSRQDRINSDEEERLRMGYEIQTGVRFAEHHAAPMSQTAAAFRDGAPIADLAYGHAARLWRINRGWKRRKDRSQLGFLLDAERGYWARNQEDREDDHDDPLSASQRRVIPFVEDRRNCLLVTPRTDLSTEALASLQAALKNAIQVEFQLEESELAAESLPSEADRRLILLYEAAEGGAGALRRLVDERQALARVARRALDLCHFDPETGEDRRRPEGSTEDCEAACYDCLMSYTNQRDHRLLDRQEIRGFLLDLARSEVESSPAAAPRAEHLARLKRQCESDLEQAWLDFVEARRLKLPSKAQKRIEAANTRPDFLYEQAFTAIYVDGPPHRYPERRKRDEDQTARMEDRGYTVLRFPSERDWPRIVAEHPETFGGSKGVGS